jgi:uncharacterized protein YbaR (Trm112 family)
MPARTSPLLPPILVLVKHMQGLVCDVCRLVGGISNETPNLLTAVLRLHL